MEIQNSPRLRPEIYRRAALQNLQNDDLPFNECRQGRGLSGFIAQPRQVVTRYWQNVEPLTQPFTQDEQFDAGGIASRGGVLMNKSVEHERTEVAVDRGLRRFELPGEVGNPDRFP